MLRGFSPESGMADGAWKKPLCPRGRSSSQTPLRVGGGPLPRRSPRPVAILHGSTAGDDLRSRDRTLQPSRDDALPGCLEKAVLSLRTPGSRGQRLSGRRQRIARLQDLPRRGFVHDRFGAPGSPCRSGTPDAGSRDLCPRCHHHRLVPEAVSLGQVPPQESRRQTAHARGPAGANPVFIAVSDGKYHEVNTFDTLHLQPVSYIVFDKGYIDFGRLYRLHQAGCVFVTRAKRTMNHRVHSRRPVNSGGPVQAEQLSALFR